MEEINLKDFYGYYKKYTLAIIIVCLLFLIVALVYNIAFKTPMYSTSTTILLVKNETADKEDSNDQNDITLNQKLVSTYRQIIKSRLVLEQVIKKQNLNYSFEKLYKEINVSAVEDTEIIRITVTDESATNACNIANEIASVFDKEVKQIYNINNVSIIDVALVPNTPSNDNVIRDGVLAVLIGFVFMSAIVFVIFYFDDTIRDTETMETDLGLPVIAKVFRDKNDTELIVDKKPNASSSESIRTLRTNLQFASIDSELRTMLVTSSLPGEGKSFVSANLAISFAQAGKRTLLIDCDLRKGRQHKLFKIAGRKGLSNLLINEVEEYPKYIAQSKIENLFILPRGTYPPNPSELLNSKKNQHLIELLKGHFDIIILDGAPIVGLSDSLILSSMVDKVLLVTSINNTPKTEVLNTKRDLENVGANIAGLVANNVIAKKGHYGSYYYYYGYDDEGNKVEKKKK